MARSNQHSAGGDKIGSAERVCAGEVQRAGAPLDDAAADVGRQPGKIRNRERNRRAAVVENDRERSTDAVTGTETGDNNTVSGYGQKGRNASSKAAGAGNDLSETRIDISRPAAGEPDR